MNNNQSNNKSGNSRRTFIRNSAAAAAGFYIIPRHVMGRGFIAPSDKLNLAGIGVGGKGNSDINNAWNNGSENVVALCDVDWGYAKAPAQKFADAKKYNDYRKMFDEMGKSIDAVTISTPDHMHAPIAMAAMQLGKHVYVQKPLTHDIYEARMLTEAAHKYKVVTQMGNQGASSDGSSQLVEWFDKGIIGKVDTAYIWTNRPVWPQGIPFPTETPALPSTMTKEDWDLWIGSAPYFDYNPLFHPFKWRGWWPFGTGALGDMGCHLIDPAFRVLGLGYPTEVECSVGQVFVRDWNPEYIPNGCPPSSHVQLKFPASKKNPSELKMVWSDGGIRPFHPDLIPADDFIGEPGSANGGMLIGEKGIMTFGTYGMAPQVYLKDGTKLTQTNTKTELQKMPESGHQVAWTRACKAGFESKEHKSLTSSFDYSGPLTETVLMGNLAIRSYGVRVKEGNNGYANPGRKKLLWDGKNMKITNFDDANQFVKRTYRDGYSLGV
ncbi:Gfo/Idh/MocA family oxidoreductase [Panacibacter ginsenosidivorans]|uniref:Gfo/Idh/MocA family oxidoreductase n=1 Tax=Panacibacter ginsenosidivorans TaxID=1813871 RepID=A0A5B8VBP9_9BACT|nr:Gfo/Idh/MocA family oxidoreductase [Panacibacter ginsenosidivorans]QEC68361.1 Gfo/Idh/MocA family oxidoreductase [Panacibacter ginsenosidivorans]